MPISIQNQRRYPGGSIYSKEWQYLRNRVNDRSGGRCEGSPKYPDCRAKNYKPHPVTGSRVVLTVAHLDHTPENSDMKNLKHWCQRCHNTYDAPHRAANRAKKKKNKTTINYAVNPDSIFKKGK